MKAVKWIAIGVGVVILVVCGIGLILPAKWEVNTSVVIDAKPAAIYPHIATPKIFVKHFEAYSKSRPENANVKFEYEFSEVEVGEGAWWVSKSNGSTVKIEITKGDPAQGMWYDSRIESDEINGHGSITFTPEGDGTKVTWDDGGDLPPVIGGFLGSMISGQLEEYFHGALNEVKKAVEAGAGK